MKQRFRSSIGSWESRELKQPQWVHWYSVKIDSMDFRYADAEEVWQQARGTGQRRILDTLDATQKKHAVSLLTERMNPHQRHDGCYITATALLAVANR